MLNLSRGEARGVRRAWVGGQLSPGDGRAATPDLGVLDGLRGLAICGVVAYHLLGIGPTLAVGGTRYSIAPAISVIANIVDVFFFVSGFVIFYPYARHLVDGTPEPSAQTFYLRRAFKIVPSYALSCVAAVALGTAHFADVREAFVQTVTHATFTHTFSRATFGGIDGVLWSLGIEVQFYAIFPLLWLAARRRFVATIVVCVAIAAAYRLAIGATFGRADFLTYQLPGVLDLIGAGMATAYAYRAILMAGSAARLPTVCWTALAAIGGIAEILLLAHIDALDGISSARVAPLTDLVRSFEACALALLTLGSLFAARAWRAILASGASIFIAGISYNLYLWHKIVGDVVRAHVHGGVGWLATGAIVGSFAIATCLTFAFERPAMALLKRRFAVE